MGASRLLQNYFINGLYIEMKRFFNFLAQPPIMLSIPLGMMLGFIVTSNLSTADQQQLADYGLDQRKVIAIFAGTFFGASTLAALIAQPFRSTKTEFLIQIAKDQMAGLEISQEDQDTLTKGIWEISEEVNRGNPTFCVGKLEELIQQFTDPSENKSLALQKFQEALRSS